VRRLVAGGFTVALITAAAVATVPTGASAVSLNNAKASPSSRALAERSAHSLVASQAPALRASRFDRFVARPTIGSDKGLQYVPYERLYKGLRVVGGDFVVTTDANGHILGTSVAQTRKTSLRTTTPTLSKARAKAISKRQLRQVSKVSAARLVVLQKGGSHLAWETRVDGTLHGERSSLSVYVDAHSGKVLSTTEHVMAGDGTAAYSGPNPLHLDTTQSGSTFSMQDPVHTTLKCQDAATNTTFSGPDDLWGNGNATSRETGCVDALFAAQTEYKMLSGWLGRNGMDGNGGSWPIRVGLNDVNAYYDGTQVQIGHTQTGGKWIGSIDVVAHEMGHGIDDHTPGGISRAGTQEFVADTFGAMTEWYANEGAAYDPPDYEVGEEINLVGQGPIRYMYDPSKAGDDNCYSSSTPNDEVHAAAGPGNHWFYLTAEGTNPTNGQPTSPTCNGTTIAGLGIQKAAKIMYNAMLMKTSTSSYLKYRTWTLTAAKNLFPGSCTEFNTVKAAWNAVSVPAQAGDPTCTTGGNTVTVNNPGNRTGTVGTATSLQITATDSQAGQTLTYSATGLPAGLSINASSGLISGTPTAAGTSNVTVTAKDTTNAQGSTSFTWTINPSGGGGTSQLLLNPGFESGAVNWTGTAGPVTNNTGRPARTGSWKMWLGGNGTTASENEAQTVTIPANATSATLSFWIRIDTSEAAGSTAYDTAKVQIVNGSTTSTLATYSNVNANNTYVQKSFDLTSYKGKTISVKFLMSEDYSLQTSFVVDDTALNVVS
jgi:Zn-dependent metalloprotease